MNQSRPRTQKEFREKFLSLIDKTPHCWNFKGMLNKGGYGRIKFSYKTLLAHRESWKIHKGQIPRNKLVCHTCDNPSCVNPKHLFLGTHLDNNLDKISKGRDHNASKTHCPSGHEYSKANTSIHNNKRKCKTCDRIRHREKKNALKRGENK